MRSARLGAAFLVAVVAGCSGGDGDASSTAVPADEAERLLIDRNWLDRWPQSKDERLHVYRFTLAMGGGVYQDRTLFKGSFELFVFRTEGERLEIDFPDDGLRVRTRYRIERVDGPEPFDLRLTFDEIPRGPRVYHGMSSESGAGLSVPLALEQ